MDLLDVSRVEAACILRQLEDMYGLKGREALEYIEGGSDALYGAWDACATASAPPTYAPSPPAAPPTTRRYVVRYEEFCDYSGGTGYGWLHYIEYYSDGSEREGSRGVLC